MKFLPVSRHVPITNMIYQHRAGSTHAASWPASWLPARCWIGFTSCGWPGFLVLGGNNFPGKIIAAADKLGALRIVADEVGNPTYAPDVATAIAQLITTERYGIYHLVNRGQTSRFEFAQAVLQATGRGNIPLTPIAHTEWPRPVQPPLHAVLINQAAAALGIELRPWQAAVDEYVKQLAVNSNQ